METTLGVEGERDPGAADVRAHHLLYRRGQRDLAVLEALVFAVGDGAVVEQRREHLADGLFDGRQAGDVQEGLLLAGKRCIGQVFGGRR